MASSGISARGIEMRYARRDGPPVLEGVDIEIPPGSFVTLLGPSGCGKTTLLKVLGGILEPTAGEVRIGGVPTDVAVRNREIGLVPQRPALLPWKTALQNARMLRELAGGRRSEDSRVAAEQALALVGLSKAASMLPHELSGGMAQRVSIARALAMDPKILLMDEPFGALDAITRDQMNEVLAGIWAASGKTVVFVTHSIAEAVFLSDVVHMMGSSPGRIVESVNIHLPRPRTSDLFNDAQFNAYVSHLRAHLEPTTVA